MKRQNRLANEKSPYLLQHSENPVDWYPWGEEAFQKAEIEDKLIFLSIGYSTCHWCHVMEKESFEDPKVASLLNKDFVSIKVDREERPDIDSIYMDAVQLMGERGGWPLNIFLTPKKKPIIGGTYFPKVQINNQVSFINLLNIVSDSWKNKKLELTKISERLTEFLTKKKDFTKEKKMPGEEIHHKCFQGYLNAYDSTYGGFTTNYPNKFPPSMGILFLLKYYKNYKNPKALEMSVQTLYAMKKGGIYDQIGGGLCRYATDQMWHTPHFEKMLYDNALFLQALAKCYEITKDPFLKDSSYEVISYIKRDLQLPDFGISSAEDADSEGEEGKFYLWEKEEIAKILGEDFFILEKFWNISTDQNSSKKIILHESFKTKTLFENHLQKKGLDTIIKNAKIQLLQYREKRTRPKRDDKVLTSWNSLYIKALSIAGSVFQDFSLVQDAIDVYRFIETNLFTKEKRLLRRYREKDKRIPGFLQDYAEFGLASLYLYRITFDISFLKNADFIAKEIIRLFYGENGEFYSSGSDSEQLIRRSIDAYDGVEPSANSSTAELFLRLSEFGIEDLEYKNFALKIFQLFSDELNKFPTAFPVMGTALFRLTHPDFEIAVVSKSKEKASDVLEYLKSNHIDSTVIFCENSKFKELSDWIGLLKMRDSKEDTTIFVCRNGVCGLPVFQLSDLIKATGNS